MVNEFHQRTNRLGNPSFNSWMEKFLIRLYLPLSRTLVYQNPLPMRIGSLEKKITKSSVVNSMKITPIKYLMCGESNNQATKQSVWKL